MYNSTGYGSIGYNSPGTFVPEEVIVIPPTVKPEVRSATIRRKKRRRFFSVTFPIVGLVINPHIVQVNDVIGTKLSRSFIKSFELKSIKEFRFSQPINLQGLKRNVFDQNFTIGYRNRISDEKLVLGEWFHGYHDTKKITGTLKYYFRLMPELSAQKLSYFNLNEIILGTKQRSFSTTTLIKGKRDLTPVVEALELMTILDTLE